MITTNIDVDLFLRYTRTAKKLKDFCAGVSVTSDLVPAYILRSWQRSPSLASLQHTSLPRYDEFTTQLAWKNSPLYQATTTELANIVHLGEENSLVATLTDSQGTLLWTTASQAMQTFTQNIHFLPGTHWSEAHTGTNAIAIALVERQPCTVFASEHLLPAWQNVVCYAAPIIHPQSNQLLGVLAIATHWLQHISINESAVTHLAARIAQHLPAYLSKAELEIHALGQARVFFRGKPLHLYFRQLELICILALHPQGLTLENLHTALYGDTAIASTATKTMLTQLRHLLDGQISYCPYRLLVPVWADFIELATCLRQRCMANTLKLYQGALLPMSESPLIEEWRNHIDAEMDALLNTCESPQFLLDHADNLLSTPLVRERLLALLG